MIRLSRASILARVICCGVLASSAMAVLAADSPKSASNASESSVLKRIQGNWKARGERLTSFYFAWDSQSVLPEPSKADRGNAAPVTHCEYWFQGTAGNAKYRIHTTRADSRLKQGASTDEWQLAFDGTTMRTFDSADLVGTVHSGYWGFDRVSIELLLFAMRPLSQKVVDPSSNEIRVIGENAFVGQRRCIKLRQHSGNNFAFDCWVDPEREDVIAGWERRLGNAPLDFVSIEYKREHNEWLPARWTATDHSIPGNASTVNSVTKSATNEKFNEKLFVLEFPRGAVVLDKKLKQNYVLQKDGTRKPLSADALRIYESLEQGVDFTIESEPLKDALAFIGQRYAIKVTIDPEATRKGLVDPAIEVQTRTAGFQMKRILRQLLDQSPKPLTWKVQNGELLIIPAAGATQSPKN